ncbi:S-protein homolog 6-like [Impatiens glandulifera]|uniref:S-protein homolog 6-like n=1 Tax=Impatiens glandulifera TaxID=253017 RepID=UPI001FB0592A|nr:S-protein homolog 6-like [Impatiens glandulifera]
MKTLCIFIFLLTISFSWFFIFTSLVQPDYFVGGVYEIQVINGFRNNSSLPLVIWCTSGDQDDMGGRALQEGDDFGWRVKAGFLRASSHFICTLKWDDKRKRFDAFKVERDSHRCGPLRKCFWLVKEDGFYFSNDGENWMKDFSWS